jgi:hypothetical protein
VLGGKNLEKELYETSVLVGKLRQFHVHRNYVRLAFLDSNARGLRMVLDANE